MGNAQSSVAGIDHQYRMAFDLFPMLSTASSGVIYFAAFGALFCLAAMWAPLAAHLPKMFPVEVRFTGAGVGFQAPAFWAEPSHRPFVFPSLVPGNQQCLSWCISRYFCCLPTFVSIRQKRNKESGVRHVESNSGT